MSFYAQTKLSNISNSQRLFSFLKTNFLIYIPVEYFNYFQKLGPIHFGHFSLTMAFFMEDYMHTLNVNIHQLKSGKLQVSYISPIDKKRKRISFNSKKEAKEYKLKIEQKFYSQDMSYFLKMPIGKLIQIHLEKCPNSRLTHRTRTFREFYNDFSRHNLTEINTSMLREWFTKIKAKYNYSDKTLLTVKIQLNHFFKFLIEERILPYCPLAPIRFAKRIPPTRPRIYFSKDEVKTIMDNAKEFRVENHDLDYFHPFLYTIANTGARRGEILKLKWRDVDFDLNVLTFRITKLKDDRQVVMSPRLRKLIENLPRNSEYVFSRNGGEKLHCSIVTRHLQLFRQAYPMTDKEKWGYHALRHSFAYNYLKSGGSMYQLQAILGHYNIVSTVNTYGRIKASDDEFPSPYDF